MGEEYRELITQRLIKRDSEIRLYVDLMQTNSQHSEEVISLRHQNTQLTHELSRLRRENNDMHIKLEIGGGKKSERFQVLEQKLFRAQEELTEVLRTKGANVQQLMNLNLALQETEKEKQSADDIVDQKTKEMESLIQELEDIKSKYAESLKANEMLQDEHDVLDLLCDQLEIKLRDSEIEKQLLELKTYQAEQIEKERTTHNMMSMKTMRAAQTTTNPRATNRSLLLRATEMFSWT